MSSNYIVDKNTFFENVIRFSLCSWGLHAFVPTHSYLRIFSNLQSSNSFLISFRNLEALMSFPSNLSFFSNPSHASLKSLRSSLFLRSSGLSCVLTRNAIVSVLLTVLMVIAVALLTLKAHCIAISLS